MSNGTRTRARSRPATKTDYPVVLGVGREHADFLGGAEFDGNRWNDLHYSRAVKLAARERAKGGKS
jgi:hypothetical protein